MIKSMFFLFFVSFSLSVQAQQARWQQRVKYTMKIDMNVETNRYTGRQKIDYWNNSPDTLDRLYFHLYWNAFQPNSMMDMRSRRQGSIVLGKDRDGNDVQDWDPRVEDRISKLSKEEEGYERVVGLKVNGRSQQYKVHETILEVVLDRPVLPRSTVVLDMDWEAQVPLQVRRSGRDNPYTNVRYTMTQWYPKLCEYDEEGWHPTPYVGREFYGVWGDYDVSISIDKNYMLGGSGTVVNGDEVGFGYEAGSGTRQVSGKNLTWRFLATNVHDFAWAADAEYKQIKRTIPGGPTIRVVYNNKPTVEAFEGLSAAGRANYNNDFNKYSETWDKQWELIADAAVVVYPFIKKNFGEYPYKQYSFIHGGDGGMEYPNCTMLVSSSLGTAFHEWIHSWYQGMLGTNESKYGWMDEGFTEYATNLVEEYYRQQVSRKTLVNNPAELKKSDSLVMNAFPLYHAPNYTAYYRLAKGGREEPLTTHADHFNTNTAYSNASYNKGAVFMEQLGYVIGAPARDRILHEYYRQWRFKHPNANDFIRLAEKQSKLELDWYGEYWINTTKTIDYGIDSLWEAGSATQVRLRQVGAMPMPIDIKLSFKDGTSEWHYIPMYLMFGQKPAEAGQAPRITYEAWKWTHPVYTIQTKRRLTDIVTVEIDPSQRMADVERKNNRLDLKW